MSVLRRIAILLVAVAAVAVPLASADDAPPPAETGGTTDTGGTTAPGVIAAGVTVYGVDVGGMTADQAKITVQAAFDTAVQFTWKKRHWWAAPDRLGGKAYVAGAVNRALTAVPGRAITMVVTVKGAVLDDYVAYLNRNFAQSPKNSTLRLVNLRPRISKPRDGLDINESAMRKSIIRALKSGDRGPLTLEATVVKPTVTLKNFGPIIVIRRISNQLYLYRGQRFWRKFGVATGQSAYPTPTGNFSIAEMWKNPWWYPRPTPVGPRARSRFLRGPATRSARGGWVSAPLVGIHGTPDAASVGYSASHGCIRMRIPDAEWLFAHVRVGTPVFIRNA